MTWRYTCKNGKALRDAIELEDCAMVLDALLNCYYEIEHNCMIECEEYIDEVKDMLDGDYDDDDVNCVLREFYDLCDNYDIWVAI